ncbi:cell wall hydrolase [Altererythrobacter sp. BO-6]|uniref:cell wall hydrolase n=1 Tax=Altererythrobacter sp. BO-6 TaxID=2604537 RepID=UPI0013E1D968|nr:cell wall hydrolase [Altererythrobacter sp. BO-6]QIG54200.1 cell wall hydrolase [Altererythrobacter sp. BO-6]
MIRRSHGLGLAAGAAVLGLTFSGAEFSGAFAQVTEPGLQEAADAAIGSAEEAVPQFVSQEVVQPLPSAAQADLQADRDEATAKAASLHALVAATDTDFALSEQMRCLAGAVYFEARGEPLAGQLAVAQVVINRTESGRFPSSYCGVVYQRAQFSFVRGGEMPQVKAGSQAWQQAKAIARIAHEGLWDSEAGDALYFHAKYVRPSWSHKKTARATINRHVFYR